jgi:hypothetical protein
VESRNYLDGIEIMGLAELMLRLAEIGALYAPTTVVDLGSQLIEVSQNSL